MLYKSIPRRCWSLRGNSLFCYPSCYKYQINNLKTFIRTHLTIFPTASINIISQTSRAVKIKEHYIKKKLGKIKAYMIIISRTQNNPHQRTRRQDNVCGSPQSWGYVHQRAIQSLYLWIHLERYTTYIIMMYHTFFFLVAIHRTTELPYIIS